MKKTIKIAIQGYPGAFHEIAARLYHKTSLIEVLPCNTFADVARAITEGAADSAMMAIENSIAGSLLGNYHLIHHTPLQISGEVYLRIKQNLLAFPGSTIEDITEVHSHYMAIAQSKKFFNAYPHIKLVETRDTAQSALHIAEGKLSHIGAIASSLAAQLYGLNILNEGIETNKLNYTRFFVVDKRKPRKNTLPFDKVSVSFTLSHTSGSLFHAMSVLNDYQVNLTKIQSMPIPGKPWEYLFFVDFIVPDQSRVDQLTGDLYAAVHDLSVLGRYKSGSKHEN
jgi:prephenate dehydratase